MSAAAPVLLGNVFTDLPAKLGMEWIDPLVTTGAVRIERIVSRGQCSPDGFWYDQDEHEWVLLLAGGAELRFAEPDRTETLRPGGHVLIPAHTRHRVESTLNDVDTVWLAVFFEDRA